MDKVFVKDNELNYEDFVSSLTKDGQDILDTLTPEKAHIVHMAIGVVGEAGELIDAIKKYVIYCKDLDLENVIEECGDIEFYMQDLRKAIGISREQTLQANADKLSVRYSEGKYSDVAAQVREDKIEPESRGL